jgi:predicted small secreted protein
MKAAATRTVIARLVVAAALFFACNTLSTEWHSPFCNTLRGG